MLSLLSIRPSPDLLLVCDGRFLMSLASICYEVIVYLFPRTIFALCQWMPSAPCAIDPYCFEALAMRHP